MSAKKIKNVNIQNVINEQMKGLDHARSQLLAIIGAYNTNVAEHNSVYKNKIPFLALDFSSSNKKFFVLQKT